MRIQNVLMALAVVPVAVLLGACSPTYNWRELRVGDLSVAVLLPCKPEQAEREVPLQGQTGTLQMASCDVGDVTFAVASLRVPEGVGLNDAAKAWKAATLASLKASLDTATDWPQPTRVGWAATGWQARGARHNGQPVQARVTAFARGQILYQFAVYGEPPAEVLSTWVEGMRVVPGS